MAVVVLRFGEGSRGPKGSTLSSPSVIWGRVRPREPEHREGGTAPAAESCRAARLFAGSASGLGGRRRAGAGM